MHKLILSAFLLVTLLAMSCKDEKDPDTTPSTKANINFKVNITAGGSPFELNKTYKLADGQEYSVELLKFYLSDLVLVKEDGSKLNMKELLLIDPDKNIHEPYDKSTIGTNFTFEVEAGNYKTLELGVGVPKRMNVVSNDYENNHPLSVYRGTDWSWAGYRFVMMEGSANNGNGADRNSFSYHLLTDSLYHTVVLNKDFNIKAGVAQDIVLQVDLNKIMRPIDATQNIDPVKDPITHTDGSEEKINLAKKVMRNFSKSIGL